jgi:hypothetical protein
MGYVLGESKGKTRSLCHKQALVSQVMSDGCTVEGHESAVAGLSVCGRGS